MVIIAVFFFFLFELCLKNYGRLNATVPKYYISREARFYVRCNYSVPRSVNLSLPLCYVRLYFWSLIFSILVAAFIIDGSKGARN